MPELEEVFRMSTQKVRPEPGALERQFGKQRRRSTRQKVAVYALVVGLIVGAAIGLTTLTREDRPANPPDAETPVIQVEGLPPTAELLQGVWYEDPGTGEWPVPVMASFTPDGTFSMGSLDQGSWLSGTYEVEGQRIRFTVTGGACLGIGGLTGAFLWDAGIVAEGRLEATHRGSTVGSPDNVGTCLIRVGEPYNFTRVSPTSPAAADIVPGRSSVGEGPLTIETTAFDLDGLWLVEGTGHVLSLEWSGTYRLDGEGELATTPYDAGSVEIGRGTLRFITGGDSAGCAEGDVMVWKSVRFEEGRLLGEVTADSCGRDIDEEITLLFLNVDAP